MRNQQTAKQYYPVLQGRGLDIMVEYTLSCGWIIDRIKKDIAAKELMDKDLQPKRKGIDVTA